MRQLTELIQRQRVDAVRHLPPSLRLLGAELEERSLLVGSELVALFAGCFSCSCAAILLSPPVNRSGSPSSRHHSSLRLRFLERKKSNFEHAARENAQRRAR
jgi:hypothetical protein